MTTSASSTAMTMAARTARRRRPERCSIRHARRILPPWGLVCVVSFSSGNVPPRRGSVMRSCALVALVAERLAVAEQTPLGADRLGAGLVELLPVAHVRWRAVRVALLAYVGRPCVT